MKLSVLGLVVALLVGCANSTDRWGYGYAYREYGAVSQEQHRDKDFSECTQETLNATAGSRIQRFQEPAYMQQCMWDRGWKTVGPYGRN